MPAPAQFTFSGTEATGLRPGLGFEPRSVTPETDLWHALEPPCLATHQLAQRQGALVLLAMCDGSLSPSYGEAQLLSWLPSDLSASLRRAVNSVRTVVHPGHGKQCPRYKETPRPHTHTQPLGHVGSLAESVKILGKLFVLG